MPDSGAPPLVVDLDGCLTPGDTLIESIIQVLKRHPGDVLRMARELMKGRAAFKAFVACRARFSPEHLPYSEPLLRLLRDEKRRGRRLILATGAHRVVAEAVASHLGLFDQVLATEDGINLKGANKLRAIRKYVGERFVYAADNRADLAVWSGAQAAVLVGASPRLARRVRASMPVEHEFPREAAGAALWLRALRVHQWLKNLLLFVPMFTAFSFLDTRRLGVAALGFAAFCLAASGSYLLNDLWDLESDRGHPRKRERPLASGRIPIAEGLVAAAGALAVAAVLGSAVSGPFLAMLLLYLGATSLYSWVLKEYVVLDVLALSLLYTLRIVAGAVAVDVAVSYWLLAFSVFIFFSLALVKRCTELVSLRAAGAAATLGRDYRVADLVVLWPLGVVSALCAVVVFGLFINDAQTLLRYSSPQLLWVVALGLIYWLSRVWILCARGEMHDDPVVFAVRDRTSQLTVIAMAAAVLAARFLGA